MYGLAALLGGNKLLNGVFDVIIIMLLYVFAQQPDKRNGNCKHEQHNDEKELQRNLFCKRFHAPRLLVCYGIEIMLANALL